MSEQIQHVKYEVSWKLPRRVEKGRTNSDAARTRLREAADAAVLNALGNDTGEASVTFTVKLERPKAAANAPTFFASGYSIHAHTPGGVMLICNCPDADEARRGAANLNDLAERKE